jgi:hypothetical protein
VRSNLQRPLPAYLCACDGVTANSAASIAIVRARKAMMQRKRLIIAQQLPRGPLSRVEVSSNYPFIASIGADCREGAVQSLATRVIPFPHPNPDARAEPAFVVKPGSHKLVVGTQRSLQEAGARRRNLHQDRIIATECEVDDHPFLRAVSIP